MSDKSDNGGDGRCRATNLQGKRCGRKAMSGLPVCQDHGTGGSWRESREQGLVGYSGHFVEQGNGQVARRGRYERRLPQEYQDLYLDFLSNPNPLPEVAILRVSLVRLIDRLTQNLAFIDAMGEEGDGDIFAEKAIEDKEFDRLYQFINAGKKVIDAIVSAYDKLDGKKIVVTFTGEKIADEVQLQVNEFLKHFLDWLPPILCGECRTKVSEELIRQQQVLVSSGDDEG